MQAIDLCLLLIDFMLLLSWIFGQLSSQIPSFTYFGIDVWRCGRWFALPCTPTKHCNQVSPEPGKYFFFWGGLQFAVSHDHIIWVPKLYACIGPLVVDWLLNEMMVSMQWFFWPTPTGHQWRCLWILWPSETCHKSCPWVHLNFFQIERCPSDVQWNLWRTGLPLQPCPHKIPPHLRHVL